MSLSEKVKNSIDLLQRFEPGKGIELLSDAGKGYHLAFSGGKDSVVVKHLMELAGVKYDAHYRCTSVDPPELVHFIKEHHKDVEICFPRYKDGSVITMWNLIPRKRMPPTRIHRYCCEYLKEDAGDGRVTVTGVRWAESNNRAKHRGALDIKGAAKEYADDDNFRDNGRGDLILVNDNAESREAIDACVTRHKTCVNPIIDWTDEEVWEFIRAEKIPYCGLYDEGFHRLGCIGCPMAARHGREREFARWPTYQAAYIRAFGKMIEAREAAGLPPFTYRTAEDVYNWWMEYKELPGQTSLF